MDQGSIKPIEAVLENQALEVRKIEIEDLRSVLLRGIEDFQAMPTHAIFLAVLYGVVGMLLVVLTAGYDLLPIAFPLIAGFTLLGPFAALGMYELSRRRELGEDISRYHMFEVINSQARLPILMLGAILFALFIVWIEVAFVIYGHTLGPVMAEGGSFVGSLFGTGEGWTMMIIGNAIGALFAVLVFTISVVSFPLLLDRHVSLPTAVATSVAAVVRNPLPMALWGAIVAGSLAVGSVPFFLGLAIVMPVLGHATWHLYKTMVVRPNA